MNVANHLHTKAFPLPKSDFMYQRSGPWPQPAPDHPMAMAAEVLHLPKADIDAINSWFARPAYRDLPAASPLPQTLDRRSTRQARW